MGLQTAASKLAILATGIMKPSFVVSDHLANPGCGLPQALEALGAARTFIVRGMEAVMLETLSQVVAAVLLVFLDIRHLVSLWVAAIHVRCINARRTDLVANPGRGNQIEVR